jgi:hypothetical protein
MRWWQLSTFLFVNVYVKMFREWKNEKMYLPQIPELLNHPVLSPSHKYTYKVQQCIEMSAQQNCIWNVITFGAVLHKNDYWHSCYIAANINHVTSNCTLHYLNNMKLNTLKIHFRIPHCTFKFMIFTLPILKYIHTRVKLGFSA